MHACLSRFRRALRREWQARPSEPAQMAPVGCSQRCNLGACFGHASIGAPTRLTSRAKPTPVQRCIVNVAAGQTLCIERPITSPSCSTWARGTSKPPRCSQPGRSHGPSRGGNQREHGGQGSCYSRFIEIRQTSDRKFQKAFQPHPQTPSCSRPQGATQNTSVHSEQSVGLKRNEENTIG